MPRPLDSQPSEPVCGGQKPTHEVRPTRGLNSPPAAKKAGRMRSMTHVSRSFGSWHLLVTMTLLGLMMAMAVPKTGTAHASVNSLAASGVRNPQMRLCWQSQGQFESWAFEANEWGFCAYSNSRIDTLSLVAWVESRSTQALLTLADEALASAATNCAAMGGRLVSVPSDELCVWADASALSSRALGSTPEAQALRVELREALNRL